MKENRTHKIRFQLVLFTGNRSGNPESIEPDTHVVVRRAFSVPDPLDAFRWLYSISVNLSLLNRTLIILYAAQVFRLDPEAFQN